MKTQQVNYREMLKKRALKAKQEVEDFDEKPLSLQDLRNKENIKRWEERRRQAVKSESTLPSFKQFLAEWHEPYECIDCGDVAMSTEEDCSCGSNNWREIDPEPPEYCGEPEESWQERNERLGIKPR